MSSSDSKRFISEVTQNSPISELFKVIKYSFRECEFKEVEHILTCREKNMKMEMENLIRENNMLKLELNEKTSEFRKKDLEGERLLGKYMEKFKFSDEKVMRIEEELENLRWEKLVANQTVEDLRLEKSVFDRTVEEFKSKLLEADSVVENAESDMSAEFYKSRLENLAPRIMKMEEALANILNVKVEDLSQLVNNLEKPEAVEEGAKVEFPMDENVIIMSPGAGSMCNSAGSGCAGLSKEGDRNVDQTSPGSQYGRNPLEAEINNNNQDDGQQSKPDIIEICDSDDETNPKGAAAYISPKADDVEKKEIIAEKFAHTPSLSNRNKRKITDFFMMIKNRKCNIYDDLAIDEKDNEILLDSEDDESCSGARITSKGKKRWNFVADMLRDFNENEEILLEAVCALYRHHIRAEKSSRGSKFPKRGGLSHKDSMSLRDVAKFLIDGDSELRLRKSISEVKQQKPDFVSECRRLAKLYDEQVYKIYCNKEDPFFC